jgi:hypothetical protein
MRKPINNIVLIVWGVLATVTIWMISVSDSARIDRSLYRMVTLVTLIDSFLLLGLGFYSKSKWLIIPGAFGVGAFGTELLSTVLRG